MLTDNEGEAMTDQARQDLIEKAADAIRWSSERGGWLDMAEAALAVFEEAEGPTVNREPIEKAIRTAREALALWLESHGIIVTYANDPVDGSRIEVVTLEQLAAFPGIREVIEGANR